MREIPGQLMDLGRGFAELHPLCPIDCVYLRRPRVLPPQHLNSSHHQAQTSNFGHSSDHFKVAGFLGLGCLVQALLGVLSPATGVTFVQLCIATRKFSSLSHGVKQHEGWHTCLSSEQDAKVDARGNYPAGGIVNPAPQGAFCQGLSTRKGNRGIRER